MEMCELGKSTSSVSAGPEDYNMTLGCLKSQTDSGFQVEKAILWTDYWDNKELREEILLL